MRLFREVRRLLQSKMSLNWVRGRYTADGFVWHVRGGEYSMSHEDWARTEALGKGGELFVDIGANVGTWALRASRSFDKVIAFVGAPCFDFGIPFSSKVEFRIVPVAGHSQFIGVIIGS